MRHLAIVGQVALRPLRVLGPVCFRCNQPLQTAPLISLQVTPAACPDRAAVPVVKTTSRRSWLTARWTTSATGSVAHSDVGADAIVAVLAGRAAVSA